MQYLMLIYEDEALAEARDEAAMGELVGAYREFTEAVQKTGHMLGGDALQPIATATSVRVRDGKTLLTDGPFAETKEQLGGYYLIEAADLDEATAIAARIPTAATGTIEVRPVMTWPPS